MRTGFRNIFFKFLFNLFDLFIFVFLWRCQLPSFLQNWHWSDSLARNLILHNALPMLCRVVVVVVCLKERKDGAIEEISETIERVCEQILSELALASS
jgi:hypothetical protein